MIRDVVRDPHRRAGPHLRHAFRAVAPGMAVAAVLAGAALARAAPLPSPPAPPLVVTSFYEGRLYLKVLDVRADDIVGAGGYQAGARIQSSGVVRMVKPVSLLAQVQGRMVQGYPVPAQFTVHSGGKHRSVAMGGLRAADAVTQVLRLGLRGPASPCAGPLPIYDGKQSYVLAFSPAGGGDLSSVQRGFGLSTPTRCRLSFRPVTGFRSSSMGGALRGDSFATFARSTTTGFWVLSDITIGTVAGAAKIELTGLKITGRIPRVQVVSPVVRSPAGRRR